MTHLRGYRADAVLIPEPQDEKLVRANTGAVWFQIYVQGHPVHVREMGAGSNAIDAAYRVVGALRRLEADWNSRKAGREHFEHEEHPINLNIGRIEGGDWASSVPAWCRVDCRIAIYPETSAHEAAREIENAVATFCADGQVSREQSPSRRVSTGFTPRGTSWSLALKQRPSSLGPITPPRAINSKAS